MIIPYSLLGLLTGAFLNLAADELPQRRPLGSPRCPYCGQNHLPSEWMAVFSFLLLRGRCQHCRAPLSLRRPLLELGTMLAFAFLWQRYGPTPLCAPWLGGSSASPHSTSSPWREREGWEVEM